MSLDELQEKVERIYVDMENELLLNIAKKLSAGKPMEIDKWDEVNQQPLVGSGEVNEWQLQRLKELNGLNEENAKIIAKYSGKTVKEVEQVFAKAREIGMTKDEATINEGVRLGILNEINPDTEELAVRGILSSATKEVLTTFNKQNNSLLASAGSEYTNIVNKVSSQVMAGTKTVGKAMQEAVSQLAEKGLTGFTAKNGARWSPEAYTKMLLRTNTQNTINNIQEERIQACGGDFIEISSHIGARPLCSQDQGKVFSLSGYSGYIEDLDGAKVKVRPWNSSTYGEPAGILGINCGHSRYMFIPGVSKQREMDFTKKENDEAYKEKQRQRQYERTIRNKKREIAMLKQTGADDKYIRLKQNNLSNTRKEYLKFLDKTGRTRITVNEWIGSASFNLNSPDKKVTKTSKYRVEKTAGDKIYNKQIENGYENVGLVDKKGNILGKIHNSKGKSSVGYSNEQLDIMKGKYRELTSIHTHPSNSTFSINDVMDFIQRDAICDIMVETEKYEYYLKPNIEDLQLCKNNLKEFDVWLNESIGKYNDKNEEKNKNISSGEKLHKAYKDIFKLLGWKYGREKK